MDDIRKHLAEGKKIVRRIITWLEDNKAHPPGLLDLEEVRDMFVFLDGFVACCYNDEWHSHRYRKS